MNEFDTKAAIREVINAYSGAAGRLDIESFCGFFVDEAEVHGVVEMFKLPGPLRGRERIRTFFGAAFGNLEWLVQMNNITDVVLDPGGETATTSTALVETAKRRNASQIIMIGRYDDRLRLTPEGWRFTQRKLSVHRFSEVP